METAQTMMRGVNRIAAASRHTAHSLQLRQRSCANKTDSASSQPPFSGGDKESVRTANHYCTQHDPQPTCSGYAHRIRQDWNNRHNRQHATTISPGSPLSTRSGFTAVGRVAVHGEIWTRSGIPSGAFDARRDEFSRASAVRTHRCASWSSYAEVLHVRT